MQPVAEPGAGLVRAPAVVAHSGTAGTSSAREALGLPSIRKSKLPQSQAGERHLEEGEKMKKGFRAREVVLFENLLKNAIQEAILNTYVCLNATATFPLIYYESPK